MKTVAEMTDYTVAPVDRTATREAGLQAIQDDTFTIRKEGNFTKAVVDGVVVGTMWPLLDDQGDAVYGFVYNNADTLHITPSFNTLISHIVIAARG